MQCSNGCFVVRFGLVPALILLPLIALRAWLEVKHPSVAPLVGVFPLAAVWIVAFSILLLRCGASFGSLLKTAAVFASIVRMAIAAVYATAWAGKWATADGAPTRYVAEVGAMIKDGAAPIDGESAWAVWAFFSILPTLVHVVFAVLVWFVAWAIAFRGKRPAIAAA